MVCSEADCLVYGMARSALESNCVDSSIAAPFDGAVKSQGLLKQWGG